MYPISAAFEQFLQKRSRTWNLKVNIDGTEYSTSAIVGFEIENSLVSGNEFEIGTAIVSKLTLKLKIQDEIPANAKVIPYVSLSLESMSWLDAGTVWDDADFPWAGGETEWLPLGEFYIDKREQIYNVWTYTCYDKLMWANVPYVSTLTYPATMQDVWDEICSGLDYTYDSTVVIDPLYEFQAGPAGFTKRQIMGYIASSNSANVYIGKDGKVKFRQFSAVDTAVFDMGTADYIRVAQTNPIKTYTRVVVTYDEDEKLTYEAGTGDDNHTLTLENPFATQDIVDDLLTKLNGFSYMPITMDARGYPQLEAGDRISFTRNESQAWLDTNVAWDDMVLPWNGLVSYESIVLHTVYSFRGGLKMAIDAPSKSEQRSEFKVDGTLGGQINKLNQNAVKLGKAYFGATITREDGLIIEREDHASKAVFNSDELTFYKGSEKALYFDVANDIYKFNGTLEAADGVFSGELQAATGTFSGELSAATGTFTGDLTAAGGTFTGTLVGVDGSFSGTISASTIIGGFISGTTITGSLIQTQSSGNYPRIELSATDNILLAENDASNSIRIRGRSSGTGTSALDFVSTSGFMTLAEIVDTFNISGLGNIYISASGSGNEIEISSDGTINLVAANGVYANGVRLDV